MYANSMWSCGKPDKLVHRRCSLCSEIKFAGYAVGVQPDKLDFTHVFSHKHHSSSSHCIIYSVGAVLSSASWALQFIRHYLTRGRLDSHPIDSEIYRTSRGSSRKQSSSLTLSKIVDRSKWRADQRSSAGSFFKSSHVSPSPSGPYSLVVNLLTSLRHWIKSSPFIVNGIGKLSFTVLPPLVKKKFLVVLNNCFLCSRNVQKL